MSRKTVSSLMLVLLVTSMLVLTVKIQPAKAATVDWWPMFHHDLSHSGYSTSAAPAIEVNKIWNHTTGSNVVSSPAVANGYLYVGSLDAKVYCLNASTGAKIWTFQTGLSKGLDASGVESSPAVANGYVYVGSDDGHIYCLDAFTGAAIWNYTVGKVMGSLGAIFAPVVSSPAVSEGIVYVGSEDGNVYALNASTGGYIWSYGMWVPNGYGAKYYVDTSPAVANGCVYVSSGGGLFALNASTGTEIWRAYAGGSDYSSPAVANGYVYVGDDLGNSWQPSVVNAINASTGGYIWSATTESTVSSSPAVAGGVVYVGDNFGNVYALDATTGAQIWNYTTPYLIGSSPAVANGYIYVQNEFGNGNGHIYALDAATGAEMWNYTTGGELFDYTNSPLDSSPAIANGCVYIGSQDGNVYALDPSSPQTYSVSFAESGLTYGNPWSVTFNGETMSTTSNSITFNAVNGVYTFLITAPNGYNTTSMSGDITVNGAAVTKQIAFIPAYTITFTFTESGLPSGTYWAVTFNGVTSGNSANVIAFAGVEAGIYSYTVGSISGYSASPSKGYVMVNWANRNQAITFGLSDWWPMFRHDLTHSGDSTSTQPLNEILWTYTTGGDVDSSPAVAGGIVYVGSQDNKVYALNATTGAYIWSYTTGDSVFSSPAVVGGIVYIGSFDDNVYALNAETGALVWDYKTGGPVESSPAVAGGIVYVGSNDNKTYALDASTGALVWSYKTGGPVVSSPAVADGIVFVGSFDNSTYALNAATGALVWNFTTGSCVVSSPAVTDGMVFVCSYYNVTHGPSSNMGEVYALNEATGLLVWNYTTAGPVFSSPAVANGILYVGSDDCMYMGQYDSGIYALNATTGEQDWIYGITPSSPYVDSSPAVVSGTVYVGSSDGHVYALNASTGTAFEACTTGGPVSSSPAVVNGVVYVGSDGGKVYAFGSSSANHDVSVEGVITSKSVVGSGYSLGVNVTAADVGGFIESFNVTAYANTTIIASQNVTLPAGNSATITFTWNTTGLAKGNYTISAYAWPVPGETNTADNTYVGGSVLVTIPGDINGDGKVSLQDLVLLSNAYGSKPGDAKWNPNADINGDGKVSLSDLVILANHYDQHYP